MAGRGRHRSRSRHRPRPGRAAGPRRSRARRPDPPGGMRRRPPMNRRPSFAVSATASLPTRSRARIGGHVERVLERLADEDRAAIQLVAIPGRPVLADVELGRDVEQQAAGRQRPLSKARRVEDRLERRAGLARPVAGGVVLWRELRGWRGRRGRSPRCRRRRGRRRSGSRGRRARRCGGPCRVAH